jgi:peptide-methionine (S)-S-oxide reductase
MEPPFDKTEGVLSTLSGYSGGKLKNPTYEQVSGGQSGHREVIQVNYDPAKVSFAKLLEVFWKNVDPFNEIGQFCDKGEQYTSAIYFSGETERKIAETSLKEIEAKLKKKVVTKILPISDFYPAEEYHQNYYTKNPIRYKFYRGGCGRDARLKEVWGKD